MAAIPAAFVQVKLEIPHVATVERLSLRPGDRLVLSSPHALDDAEYAQIVERVKMLGLPDDVKVIVLDQGMQMQVLSREADEG